MIKYDTKERQLDLVKKLTGANLRASDLRAGASLVIAGLMAEGETIIENLHHIDRGYENFEQKFSNLGASIVRFNDEINNDLIQGHAENISEHVRGV